MGAVRHVETAAEVGAFDGPLDVTIDRNVEAGRATARVDPTARVGAHENLALTEHEVLIAGGDAGEGIYLHIHRRPLDGAVVTARVEVVASARQAN